MQKQTRRDILALGAAAAGGLALTAAAGKAKAAEGDDAELLYVYGHWVQVETVSREVSAQLDEAMGKAYRIADPGERGTAKKLARQSKLAADNECLREIVCELHERIFQMDPTTPAGIAAYLRACFWLMPGDDAIPGDESAALTVIEACERMAGRVS